MDQPVTGHDGPYDAPVHLAGGQVSTEWIDYNGHMNVAYYTHAFDRAIDQFLERELGVGETHVKTTAQGPYVLQAQVCYLAELRAGEAFDFLCHLVDCDAKRLHLMTQMRNGAGEVAATSEQILMNVDHGLRRAVPYPAWAQARMSRMRDAHATTPRPAQLGAPLGLRRRA